ncbi:MAG: DUF4118 domain-containing protein [Lachnospiraceae bacterium]
MKQSAEKNCRGHLRIFFGYAQGTGKTYTMLKAAYLAKRKGIDVVAGYVEPYKGTNAEELLKGLEQLPPLVIRKEDHIQTEFNLDAAIKRKPQLILLDELAHTNAEECRHLKRYQDVEELLRAGIDVYTTVNVQNIESLNDTVTSITEVPVKERIPDSVFDNADQVEFVDIPPQELFERMKSEEFCGKREVSLENLSAFRELALTRCVDRVNHVSEKYDFHEHILVCISASPSNEKIIRMAARMANAFRCKLTALFVETPDYEKMEKKDRERLRKNIRLAQQLGAQIETVYGDDIAYQIAEFARLAGVTKIVVGRSQRTHRTFLARPALSDQLILNAPNIDIHIIPDGNINASEILNVKHSRHSEKIFRIEDALKTLFVLVMATIISFLFVHNGFAEANIVTIYILGVLITAIITGHRFYSMILAVASVLVFNFFFTSPYFTLWAYDKGYIVTFAVMFIAAFITGSLPSRLKSHAKQAARTSYRTRVLFETNQLLQQATSQEEIVKATASQLLKLLDRDIVIYLVKDKKLETPFVFHASAKEEEKESSEERLAEEEKDVAVWAMNNNKHAGASTDTFSNAKHLYLAIRVNDEVYGVIGIRIGEMPLEAFENSMVLSILGECALALENDKNAREKEEAAILAKNEQLRSNLLRSISHDLRTPLTSISGNASNLLSNGQEFDEETKKQIYTDIYDDSMWLIDLVENLLSVTRIEEGKMNLNVNAELMDEIISEALRHINRKSVEHKIIVKESDEFIIVPVDGKLIVQVIINIVDNAVKYTPPGSTIEISAKKEQNKVIVEISDTGDGICDEAKPHVFEMFYSGANKVADSRRSLGLGLALCKAIVNAHGGEIEVKDNTPKGALFRFTLPAGEVELHE